MDGSFWIELGGPGSCLLSSEQEEALLLRKQALSKLVTSSEEIQEDDFVIIPLEEREVSIVSIDELIPSHDVFEDAFSGMGEADYTVWLWERVPKALVLLAQNPSWETISRCADFFVQAVQMNVRYPLETRSNPLIPLCALINKKVTTPEQFTGAKALAEYLAEMDPSAGARALDLLARRAAEQAVDVYNMNKAFELFDRAYLYDQSLSQETLLYICQCAADKARSLEECKRVQGWAEVLGNQVNNTYRGEVLLYLAKHIVEGTGAEGKMLFNLEGHRDYVYSLLDQVNNTDLEGEVNALREHLNSKKQGSRFCVLV